MTADAPAAETTGTGAAAAAPASAPPTPNVQISVFGRLVADPVERVSKSGTNYTTARVAVNVTGPRAAEPQTWFINVTAFRDAAARLAKCRKGSGLCLMGDLTRSTWPGNDGTSRDSWNLVANDCLSAATTRRTDP